MSIDIEKKKLELQAELTKIINYKLMQFELITGLSPSGMSVDMIDVTRINDKNKQYIACNVKLEFDK